MCSAAAPLLLFLVLWPCFSVDLVVVIVWRLLLCAKCCRLLVYLVFLLPGIKLTGLDSTGIKGLEVEKRYLTRDNSRKESSEPASQKADMQGPWHTLSIYFYSTCRRQCHWPLLSVRSKPKYNVIHFNIKPKWQPFNPGPQKYATVDVNMQIKGFPPSININDAAAVFNTLANKQLIFTIYQFKLPEHLQPLGFVHLKLFHLSLPAYCEYFRDSYLSRRQNIMANDLAKSTAPGHLFPATCDGPERF